MKKLKKKRAIQRKASGHHVDSKEKRKYIRAKSGPLRVGYIDTRNPKGKFKPDRVGLLIDESPLGGCGLVAHFSKTKLQVSNKCFIKISNDEPRYSEVRWRRPLDDKVILVGLEFLKDPTS